MSCQSEDINQDNNLQELDYKQKLEGIITLKPLSNSSVSNDDNSNVLKFKTYEEAFNYFKKK